MKLYHHPRTRAANILWMLEELGVDCELEYVDLQAGAHKRPEMLALNPMGKIPVLVDGEVVLSESTAIGLYLADRYAPGRLAPALDAPARATYLRWSIFASTVIEPACMARATGWSAMPQQAGWGTYENMLAATIEAVRGRDFVLGDTFSMADVIFGGTVRYMLQFKLIDPEPTLSAYADRLAARPALERATARNAEIAAAQAGGSKAST